MTAPPSPEQLPLLIRRAQAGDASAFEAVARAWRDRIYRWALVRTGDVDDAEDAAQEALLRLYRGLPGFAGTARFETWLFSVVRSAAADVCRRRERGRRLKVRYEERAAPRWASDPPRVVEEIEGRRIGAAIRGFLEELPARQREALDLVDLQGVGQAEAASMLGMAPATLRTHLFRARRAMRERLLADEGGSKESE